MSLLTDNQIDTPIHEFKYYHTGRNYDNSNMPAFGLYDIVADRFLHVLTSETVVKQLKYILSSRYQLYICRLDTAVNYKDLYIDNSNCHDWTLFNKQDIKFFNMVTTIELNVDRLIPAIEVPKYNVFNEKLWCLFCSHWLYKLNDEPQYIDNAYHYSKLDNYLNSFLNITEVQYGHNNQYQKKLQSIKNDILKLLYLGRDLSQVELAITQLLDNE